MGMKYKYAGLANCPKFDIERGAIAKLFSGKRRTDRRTHRVIYRFPEGTPEVFVEWANNPYGYFSRRETEEIYDFLKQKWNEVCTISAQVAYEFECLESTGEAWSVWEIC